MNPDLQHPLSKLLPTKTLGPMRSPARTLAWLSIGVGVAHLLMPRRMARASGAPNLPLLARVNGLRHVGVGVGMLNSKDPQPWLWGRAAGDALDAATVATGLLTAGRPLRTLGSVAMLLGMAVLDAKVAEAAKPQPRPLVDYGYGSRSGFPKPAAQMRGAAKLPLGGDVAAG